MDCSQAGEFKLKNIQCSFLAKIIKLVFVASLLSMQHKEERAKTGWLRIRCPSGATCLSAGHYKNPTKRVGLVQSGPHHHLIEKCPVLAML
jgi:hypothetical protein